LPAVFLWQPDLPPMPDPAAPSVLPVRPEPPCPGGMAHRACLCRLLRARPSASGPLRPLPHRAAPHRQRRAWRADLWSLRRSSRIRLHLPRMRPRWRDSQRPALLPLCAGRARPSPPQRFWAARSPPSCSLCLSHSARSATPPQSWAGWAKAGRRGCSANWLIQASPSPTASSTSCRKPSPCTTSGKCWSTLAFFRPATST
jgi:hypothetical protein